MAAAFVAYNGTQLVPSPFITVDKQYQKSDDGTNLGTLFNITLEGHIVATGAAQVMDLNAGITGIDARQDEFRNIFNTDGQLLEISCGSTILWSGYPRINNITFDRSNDNWTVKIPYTVNLELDIEGLDEDSALAPPYIESASENWQLEFIDEINTFDINLAGVVNQEETWYETHSGLAHTTYYGVDSNPHVLRLTHSVQAKGKRHYTTGNLDLPAWQQARNYVVPLLGYDADKVESSGVFNLTTTNFDPFNHARANIIDELAGTFSVTETFMIKNTGLTTAPTGDATEDFEVTVNRQANNALTVVSIRGTIQGLDTRTYGTNPDDFSVTKTRYAGASGYFDDVRPRLFSRAQVLSQGTGDGSTRVLNPIALNDTVATNPSRGTITYSYDFNDRPCFFIDDVNVLSEVVTINDSNPTNVFAQLVVLGRRAGPILQELTTTTASTRDVSIELFVRPSGGPSGCNSIIAALSQKPTVAVEALLCTLETELVDNNTQVFKHRDTESYDVTIGRYSRQVGWTYQACEGNNLDNMSFCLSGTRQIR